MCPHLPQKGDVDNLLFLTSIDDVDTCHCEKCSEEVFPIEWLSKT